MTPLLTRAAAGLVLAAAIAVAARRARSLSTSGAVAATAVGAIAIAAGWGWGAVLIAYFVLGTALSRWRGGEKARRTGAVVEKAGARDAGQVLANGGVFALAALGTLVPNGSVEWLGAAGAGALAAAAADTWATEVGTLAAERPWSLRTFGRVAPGTSGAVTARGTLAMIAGAVVTAVVARACGVAPVGPVIVGGVAGAMADTLLGAVMQERRWCARCQVETERRVHDCGTATVHVGGWRRVDNDVVNVACALLGAAVSAWLGLGVGVTR